MHTSVCICIWFVFRLRTGRTTIKVQCISVDDMHIKRDQIGQFTLPLRQAHIVPSGKSYTVII
jgi:Protein of unknown function.